MGDTAAHEMLYYDNNVSHHGDGDGDIDPLMVHLNGDNGSLSGNLSMDQAMNMTGAMEQWRVRFLPYTILAASGFFFNVLSLMAMIHVRGHRTVHHVFLQNLAVCDMVGAILLWMYYNSFFIFPHFKIQTLQHCMFIALVLVAPFLLSLCSSCLSLLMLALNQYIAICNPLFSATRISRGTACCCIVACWILAISLSTIPTFLMLALTRFEHCTKYAAALGEKSLEICTYVLTGLIVLILALYGRIYREVLEYRKRIPQLNICTASHHMRSSDSTTVGRRADTEHNFKAFVTTFLLSATLVLFWLPFMVFHFISAHISIDLIPDAVLYMKFYFIDFLPMLNFMTDPIIYGIRMREIRAGYKRLFGKLFPCCVDEPRRTFTRNSVRFTTLDTTTF